MKDSAESWSLFMDNIHDGFSETERPWVKCHAQNVYLLISNHVLRSFSESPACPTFLTEHEHRLGYTSNNFASLIQ